MGKGIGIPIKLMHEAEGHTVTVEMKSGETYRGSLLEAEDNWNLQMKDITYTAKVTLCWRQVGPDQPRCEQTLHCFWVCQDGRVAQMEHVFLRGSKIRLLIVPEMLKNAPMFKRIDLKKKVQLPMLAGSRPPRVECMGLLQRGAQRPTLCDYRSGTYGARTRSRSGPGSCPEGQGAGVSCWSISCSWKRPQALARSCSWSLVGVHVCLVDVIMLCVCVVTPL